MNAYTAHVQGNGSGSGFGIADARTVRVARKMKRRYILAIKELWN